MLKHFFAKHLFQRNLLFNTDCLLLALLMPLEWLGGLWMCLVEGRVVSSNAGVAVGQFI